MIAPIEGQYATKEEEPNTIEWTVGYYLNCMNNGLGDRLNSIAINLGVKSQDILDLKQNLYLSLRRLAENSPRKSIDNPDAYINWAFATECRLLRRKETRRKDTTLYGVEPYEPPTTGSTQTDSPLLNALDQERLNAVLESMNQISPNLAEAVRLHYFCDFTYQEASELLRVPKGTIKSRVYRGTRAIRIQLGIDLEESLSK